MRESKQKVLRRGVMKRTLSILILTIAGMWFVRAYTHPVVLEAFVSRAIQMQTEIPKLEVGKPIERELAGGQSHSYSLTLSADQFLHVAAEQRGIDVVLTLFGPNGKSLVESDNSNGVLGPEGIALVATSSGTYRVNVRSFESDALAGHYQVMITDLRQANAKDRKVAEAYKLRSDAVRLSHEKKYDVAAQVEERAAAILEKVLGSEHPDLALALLSGAAFEQDDHKAELLYQRALAIWEKNVGKNDPGIAQLLNNLALLYNDRQDYVKAEPLFQRALAIYEQAVGAEHPELAPSLQGLVQIYLAREDYDQAEKLARRALENSEKKLGPEHLSTAISLEWVASISYEKGELSNAERIYRRALSIREKKQGVDHPDLAQTLIRIAKLAQAQQHYPQAEMVYQRTLTNYKKSYGEEHAEVALTLQDIAVMYQEKQDFKKAEQYFQQAVKMGEKIWGDKHPELATMLIEFARFHYAQNDYSKAELLYRRALEIREETLGKDDIDVAMVSKEFAWLLGEKGHFRSAIPLLERVLEIQEKKLGVEHVEVATTLNELGSFFYTGYWTEMAKAAGVKVNLWTGSLTPTIKKSDPADMPLFDSSLFSSAHLRLYLEKAEEYYKRAIVICDKTLADNHSLTIASLSDLARLYSTANNNEKAIPLAERVLALQEKMLESNDPILVKSIKALASLYKNTKNYSKAESLYRRALIAAEKRVEPDRLEVARLLKDLGSLLLQRGVLEEAEKHLRRALPILETLSTSETLPLSTLLIFPTLIDLADVYLAKEDYSSAENLLIRGLAKQEKTLGPNHVLTLPILERLSLVYRGKGDTTAAAQIEKKREMTSLSNVETVISFENETPHKRKRTPEEAVEEGSSRLNNEEYGQAELYYRYALSASKGEDDSTAMQALSGLAEVYERKGEYAESEKALFKLLVICEKKLGAEHPAIAHYLHRLAALLWERGDDTTAEEYLQRGLAILTKAEGGNQRDIAFIYKSLANLYGKQGEFIKAEAFFNQALALVEKMPSDSNIFDLAQLQAEKGKLLLLIGESDKAEQSFNSSLAIWEKIWAQTRRAYKLEEMPREIPVSVGNEVHKVKLNMLVAGEGVTRNTLNRNFAIIHAAKKDYVKAEQCLEQALEDLKKELIPGKPEPREYTLTLIDFAFFSLQRGDYVKSESLYKQALESIRGRADFEDIEAKLFGELGILYWAKGDKQQAIPYYARSNDLRDKYLSRNLVIGSERQKLIFLNQFRQEVNGVLSLHAQAAPDDAQALDLALTKWLRHKSRGLDAMTDSIRQLRLRAKDQDRILFDQFSSITTQLAALELQGPAGIDHVVYRVRLKELAAQKEKLEAEIGTRSAEFKLQMQSITLAAVKTAIPKETALVEFALYTPFDQKAQSDLPARYIAYVLTSHGQPQWINLGEAQVIHKAIDALREALRNPRRSDVKELARALDAQVMRPVRQLLGGTRQVLLSPDGPLNLIPFAALVDEQNRFLVETYSFSYLTSGRDLLRLQTSSQSNNTQLVVADPDFGPKTGTAAKQEAVTTGRSFDLSKAYFAPLPGTAGEAQALQDLLPKATVLTRDKATEAALKQTNSPSILHIATHGFFLEDVPPDPASLRVQRQLVHQSALGDALFARRLENPLLRSGLGLAGANLKKSGEDDGILTALEVAGLNLWGTKLVVLSACETGVGEVKTGDGVYGLRRALVLAGSESQVMSLWKVDDAATRDLMVEYYKRLQAGEGRSEAMRQVQLQMLRGREQSAGHQARTPDVKPLREEKPSFTGRSHPYYWASFIQSGEWANLAGKR